MSRVCNAERPNSPNKDCCRRRYGSSCLVTSVATGGADMNSFPSGAGMNCSVIEVAALAARKRSTTPMRWQRFPCGQMLTKQLHHLQGKFFKWSQGSLYQRTSLVSDAAVLSAFARMEISSHRARFPAPPRASTSMTDNSVPTSLGKMNIGSCCESDATRQELSYRLRQQSLLGEFGRSALQTRDIAEILQRATELCAQGLETPSPRFWSICRTYKRLLWCGPVRMGVGRSRSGVLGVDSESPAGYAFQPDKWSFPTI